MTSKGKLTTKKWAAINKCSPTTAGGDIADLMKRGALKQDEDGARSTSYALVLKE
jgi:Fic family protein